MYTFTKKKNMVSEMNFKYFTHLIHSLHLGFIILQEINKTNTPLYNILKILDFLYLNHRHFIFLKYYLHNFSC
jgi:hypothetical protein